MALKMTVAFSGNPRVQPLVDGRVKPENIDLEVVTVEEGMLFSPNLQYDEFDASEMPISETLLAKERGDGSRWDWSALPVFLSRGHFCLGVLVNTTSGIEHLGDLKGKRIGVPDYHMTAALWMRCAMKDLYGIEASDNVWYNGRTKDFSHGGPPGVTHYWLEADQYLDQMLDLGELDAAVFSPGTGLAPGHTVSMDRYGGTPLTGNPRIRPVLDDGGRAVVAEFYRKTGAFMANHHVIVQNRILKDNPWAAMALFKAFQESKELAYQDARRQRSTYLYFQGNDEQDHAAIFGEDPYPLGLKAMRPTVERAMQGSLEQGLIRKPMRPEDIYHPSTLDT